jgi:hypothetical protein
MTGGGIALRRRAALLLALALPLAGCDPAPGGGEASNAGAGGGQVAGPEFKPLRFDYLPKLRLNAADIEVQNLYQPDPVADGEHVENLAPEPLDAAVRRMAQDRLIPAGAGGHAVLTIKTASLAARGGQYEGSLEVLLAISKPDGTPGGEAPASAHATRTMNGSSDAAVRAALYDLVKQLMSELNAELEYQVGQTLKDYLVSDAAAPATPQPVQSQDLGGSAAKQAP